MSETHQTPKPMLVTQEPNVPDILVVTAPYNKAVSLRWLLQQLGVAMNPGAPGPTGEGGGETGATGEPGP